MSAELLFAFGTLLTWLGWFLAGRAAWLGLQAVTNAPGITRRLVVRSCLIDAIVAVAFLAIGLSLPAIREAGQPGTWRLPIFWLVMPFSAWALGVSVATVLFRLSESVQALTDIEKRGKRGAALVWAVAGTLFYGWYQLDPENKVSIVKGAVPFSIQTALFLLVLVALTLGVMVWAAHSAVARGYAKAVASQLALVAGSIVFGLPFAFLLVTSFKEDRDMSSQGGIVWVPRVTKTMPYFDKKNPMYEVDFEGKTVQGMIIQDSGETAKIDIYRPLSIRGVTFETPKSRLKEVPRDVPIVTAKLNGKPVEGWIVENLEDGQQRVLLQSPPELKGQEHVFMPSETEPIRDVGLNWKNYPEALSYLPPETDNGLAYLRNTLALVVLSIIGTLLSSSIVSYAFSRMKFPGQRPLFALLLATMMLPGAVTLLPQFLIFRSLGWIDSLYPLWVPAFFGSAFNIFLLRQFFMNVPMELEDAAKIDGCSYLKTFWSIMLPQIKPALAVIFIWTFLGAWNNFMGPLIYVNSPEKMPLSYALQLFAGDRGGEPGYLMAFAAMTMFPVLLIFFLFQRYFIEGVTLSGLGGR